MKSQQGFGLLEVAVSLLIAMLVVMGLMTLSGRAFIASKNAEQQAQASYLLDSQRQMLGLMNEEQKTVFGQYLNRFYEQAKNDNQPIQAYANITQNLVNACQQKACDGQSFAIGYAIEVSQMAANHGLLPSVVPCRSGRCLAVAWGDLAVQNLSQYCQNGQINHKNCLLAELP